MKVLVYVEGPSDRDGLAKLLKPVIDDGRKNRIGITFLPLGGKAAILDDVPKKAARHLAEHRTDWVFALPDLYPMSTYDGTKNQHHSYDELRGLLLERFGEHAVKAGVPADIRSHFRVHCLKHDLEALLLAAPEVLRARLGTSDKLGKWQLPVEDQNDQHPPKYVVADLFAKYLKRKYTDTTDVPWILERAVFGDIKQACPQRFSPLVDELLTLAAGQSLTE